MKHEWTVCGLAAAVAWCFAEVVAADPLHRADNESAWQHADSGWLFPERIGAFERIATPYTIDGGSDVGANYQCVLNGARTTAVVEIYAADSAADGARFANAKAVLEADARSASGGALQSERSFVVDERHELIEVEVSYGGTPADTDRAAPVPTGLYFFEGAGWIVKVRTASEATDASIADALDEFVRAQPWDRLGVASGLH